MALGNGGAVCDLANITGDGSVINDCSGNPVETEIMNVFFWVFRTINPFSLIEIL